MKYITKNGRRVRSPTYSVWHNMQQRCNNPNATGAEYYHGRGIKVCKRWASFNNFLADMGEKPQGLTLDRIDNNGDYTPENCRWASRAAQSVNRRSNTQLNFDGQTMTVKQWERELGFPRNLIYKRLSLGWSVEKALTAPVSQKHQR